MDYWQAGLSWGSSSVHQSLIAIYLMRHDQALLKRCLRGGSTAEKERTQKVIMLIASIGFIFLLVVPTFDRRFGWSRVPMWEEIVGDALIALGCYIARAVRDCAASHVCRRIAVVFRYTPGTGFLLWTSCMRSRVACSDLAALPWGEVSCSEPSRVYRILRKSPLANVARRLL